jgi:hypothetical protein
MVHTICMYSIIFLCYLKKKLIHHHISLIKIRVILLPCTTIINNIKLKKNKKKLNYKFMWFDNDRTSVGVRLLKCKRRVVNKGFVKKRPMWTHSG